MLLLCARDVVTGLDYLHSHNITHRDLKLGNTLVSNQHYITMDGDWAKVYAECPIVCKLADFGLSRSPDMQTIWGCKFSEKVLTQFRYKTNIVGSSPQSYAVFIAIKHLQYNHVHF